MKHKLGIGLKDAKLRWGPSHLNLNMICALDIRVGGEDPTNSDLLEICVMPLNHSYRPHPEFPPFNLRMRPNFLVDKKIAHIDEDTLRKEYLTCAYDSIKVSELFELWWEGIRCKPNNQMFILTWDWPTKKPWIREWLGSMYPYLIGESHRDLLPLLNFANDRDDYRGDPVTYVQPTFNQLLRRSNIELIQRNSLMANCKAMSDAYRHLLHLR